MARTVSANPPAVTEQTSRVRTHFVLPKPWGGDEDADALARWLQEVVPPTALTFSTPFVRVPVIRPPEFGAADYDRLHEAAAKRWAAGWGLREQLRINHPLQETSTLAARYSNMAQAHPWLMLALERAQLEWRAALYLAERLTRPPLDWFTIDQAATNGGPLISTAEQLPDLGDTRAARQGISTAYRHVLVAVLADLGSVSPGWLGDPPDDENRNPSRLVHAGQICSVTRPGTNGPTRGARTARNRGRKILHLTGAWPWACRPDGDLEAGGHTSWWTDAEVTRPFDEWRRHAETMEAEALAGRVRTLREVVPSREQREL